MAKPRGLKNKVLTLRAEGKSYRAIQKELEAKKISKEEKKRLNELEKLNEENLTKSLGIENERRLLVKDFRYISEACLQTI